MEEKLPGMLAYLEPDNPGMHTTDTIDSGDTVVQNGTRHRWRNRGTEPAVLAVFLMGAHRPDRSSS